MGHSDGIITAPVNTDDVSTVLGVASHDVATLCMGGDGEKTKINMWAKYKPEKINQPNSITLTQRKSNNFGLAADTSYANKAALVNAVKAGTFTGGWSYTRPGASDWKRLDDFVGYNPKAGPPFGTLHPFEGTLSSKDTDVTRIPFQAPQMSPDAATDLGVISIEEFEKAEADYKNWYLGILLYSSARTLWATSQTPIGQTNEWLMDFGHLSTDFAGTYTGVPFLSNKAYTGTADPSGVKIIGIGQKGVTVVLKAASQSYVLFVSCVFRDDYSNEVDYVVSLKNTESTSKTFDAVYIEVAKDPSGTGSTQMIQFGKKIVAAGQTWYESGTATVSSREFCFCRAMATGVNAMNWVRFMERSPLEPEINE